MNNLRPRYWQPVADTVRVIVAIIVAIVIILLLLPSILGLYLSEVFDNVGLYLMMGLGLNIVVGFAGLLDLGYVAFFAIGAYTVGLLTSYGQYGLQHISFWVAVPIGVLVATGRAEPRIPERRHQARPEIVVQRFARLKRYGEIDSDPSGDQSVGIIAIIRDSCAVVGLQDIANRSIPCGGADSDALIGIEHLRAVGAAQHRIAHGRLHVWQHSRLQHELPQQEQPECRRHARYRREGSCLGRSASPRTALVASGRSRASRSAAAAIPPSAGTGSGRNPPCR